MTQQSGDIGPDSYEAEFLSVHPDCESHDRWRGGGGGDEKADLGSLLEFPVSPYERHGPVTPGACAVTPGPRPFTPPRGPETNSHVEAAAAAPPPSSDACSPVCSACCPTPSDWASGTSTCWEPVSAAAHLHLLGESLSLIGRHLQDTDKVLNVSISVSLLLDSLLCALGPVISLTAQVPELRSCTQHNLGLTLENISYMMPGL